MTEFRSRKLPLISFTMRFAVWRLSTSGWRWTTIHSSFFESLNSTGLDLSEGDKIRNFILMGLPSKEQEDYYEKYWNKIEVCTKYDVSAFIRDYLSVKQ